jgi:hypothetical protein
MMKHIFNDSDLKRAMEAAQGGEDIAPISQIVPRLVGQNQTQAAHDLICAPSTNRDLWRPEAYALFNIDGYSTSQRSHMLQAIYAPTSPLTVLQENQLTQLSAAIGRIGFSFPQWRYVAQGYGGQPSLLENFGFQRLQRDTDVRDPDLPPYNPNRDEYGTGFVRMDERGYIEYRRAYVLASTVLDNGTQATFLTRNSSHFFGRDRLPAPAYASFSPLSLDELQNLDEDFLINSGHFVALQDITKIYLDTALQGLQQAVTFFDQTDFAFSQWLQTPGQGLPYLYEFLAHQLQNQQQNAPTGAPFLVAHDPQMPPWFPQNVQPLSADILTKSDLGIPAASKLLLLSGAYGDLPLKPDPQHQQDHLKIKPTAPKP